MSKKKSLLWLIVALPLLLLLGAAALVLTLNPNRLKPVLYQAAAERGIDLQIAGDITWQLMPNIGFGLGQVNATAAADSTGRPLATIVEASVSVQLWPLFRRQILVDGITLSGAVVNVMIDANGQSNWSSISSDAAPEAPAATDEPAEDGELPQLEIARINVSNLNLNYDDAQTGQAFTVEGISLQSQNLALDGNEFPVELRLLAQMQDLPAIALELSGPVALNLSEQLLTTRDLAIRINSGDARAQLALTNELAWGGDALSVSGNIVLNPMAPRPWLTAMGLDVPTQDQSSLSNFSFSTPFTVNDNRIQLSQVQLKLDDTELAGNFNLATGDVLGISSHWQGTRIDLDRYLPPASEEHEPAPAEPAAEASPLPLELLRTLSLDLALNFEQISFMGLSFNQPSVQVTGKDGVIQLQNLTAQLADGSITSSGSLDARGPEALLKMNLTTQGVDINTLLVALAEVDVLRGSADARAGISSRGATTEALIGNLNLEADATSSGLRLVPVNLEQRFCEALALLQGQPPAKFDWPNQTDFEPIKMRIRLANQTLNLDGLDARIAKIIGKAEGVFDLDSGQFNLPFNLSLGGFAGSIPGCLPITEAWRNRALPIRCKGQIDNIGPATCLPDRELITTMIKDRARTEVRQRVDQQRDVIEDKAEVRARELLQEKLGGERGQAAEETLKGLLKKR